MQGPNEIFEVTTISLDKANGDSVLLEEGNPHAFISSSTIVPVPSPADIYCNNLVADVTSQNVPIPACPLV